jgi:hypothetical protein
MQTNNSNRGLTLTQQVQIHLNRQADLRRDAQVRALAQDRGANEEQTVEMVSKARGVFVAENGSLRPVRADGKTLWRRPDGWLLTIEDWVAAALPKETPRPRGVTPEKNPFNRKTWNLTEQMRLQKQDPGMAAQLRAGCAA